MGDLYRALGQGDQAREVYFDALAIRQRLADAEPDRADYQVDLADDGRLAPGPAGRRPVSRRDGGAPGQGARFQRTAGVLAG